MGDRGYYTDLYAMVASPRSSRFNAGSLSFSFVAASGRSSRDRSSAVLKSAAARSVSFASRDRQSSSSPAASPASSRSLPTKVAVVGILLGADAGVGADVAGGAFSPPISVRHC